MQSRSLVIGMLAGVVVADDAAAVCDVLEPWRYGTVVRATRYPSYFDFAHRRVDLDVVAAAEPLRPGFARPIGPFTATGRRTEA